jgi:hypothetical protein
MAHAGNNMHTRTRKSDVEKFRSQSRHMPQPRIFCTKVRVNGRRILTVFLLKFRRIFDEYTLDRSIDAEGTYNNI